ncbi:RNase adapter RapZ [Stenoxybacter acetivorans]|uniref:RNase adapter RapZ n=1 Tax=Stenoxybacter acetivorans TaxID=422441 RepID=UPI0005620728|nr:RNase adapter RapZ [Stenoxybacter acetivorans]
MRIVLISGLSGSGKSIALRLLEDVGFVCVDNLPAPMLPDLMRYYEKKGIEQLGVSIDIRSRFRFSDVCHWIDTVRRQGHRLDIVFLNTDDAVLLRRFSETRRSHPLANEQKTLLESLAAERGYMQPLQNIAYTVDTSLLNAQQLRHFIQQWLNLPVAPLRIVLESFGFKFGVPLGMDFVFDVRSLPNPFYDPVLRPYTGLDLPIKDYFSAQTIVADMIDDLEYFLKRWLPKMTEESRSYVNIGIGCTGGQHRSVYVVESLAKRLADYAVLVRHRQLLPVV